MAPYGCPDAIFVRHAVILAAGSASWACNGKILKERIGAIKVGGSGKEGRKGHEGARDPGRGGKEGEGDNRGQRAL